MSNIVKYEQKEEMELRRAEMEQKFCQVFMQSQRYKIMGEEKVMLIISTALTLGMSPSKALNGGLYCVRGKVEMSARSMSELILSKKHLIITIEASDKIVRLKGIRADNGLVNEAQFTIEQARQAGLLGNPTWKSYPEDMLYARALTKLARRSFADVIGDMYISGEINQEADLFEDVGISKGKEPHEVEIVEIIEFLNDDEILDFNKDLEKAPKYKLKVNDWLERTGKEIKSLAKEDVLKLWKRAKDLSDSEKDENV